MDPLLYNSLTEGDFDSGYELQQTLLEGDFWAAMSSNDGIVLFRGTPHPEDIDYTLIVGARFGSGNVTIPSLPHELETDYWYAARQISMHGRMETNQQTLCYFRRDSAGAADYEKPDQIVKDSLAATPKSGATIRLDWDHTKKSGTTPTHFNVYYDQGLGAASIDTSNPSCLLGTVTRSDDGHFSYTTGALSNGQGYWFVVQAEDANGNEDNYGTMAYAEADSGGPDPYSTVAGVTKLM